jgi:micrococcal nuclease
MFGALALLACIPPSAESAYYGSARSNKYHVKACYWAKKIHAVNWVVFKDRQEAQNAGYVPCKVCRP